VSSPAPRAGHFLKIKKSNMKILPVILIAGTLATAASSCNNSSAKEPNTEEVASRETADNIIRYKVNGEPVTTSGWNISRFILTNESKESLNITTNMHDERRTLNINISGTEVGEYVVKTDNKSERNFYGSYFPDYLNDLSNSYSFETGSFVIIRIDTTKNILEASFSGTVKNQKGETFSISDGKIIKGKLNATVIRYE